MCFMFVVRHDYIWCIYLCFHINRHWTAFSRCLEVFCGKQAETFHVTSSSGSQTSKSLAFCWTHVFLIYCIDLTCIASWLVSQISNGFLESARLSWTVFLLHSILRQFPLLSASFSVGFKSITESTAQPKWSECHRSRGRVVQWWGWAQSFTARHLMSAVPMTAAWPTKRMSWRALMTYEGTAACLGTLERPPRWQGPVPSTATSLRSEQIISFIIMIHLGD